MGFFDKIKASIGVGGATVSVEAPLLVSSGSTFTVVVTVKGGKLEQKVDAIDASITMPKKTKTSDGTEMVGVQQVWTHRLVTAGQTVKPDQVLRFEIPAEAPLLQSMFEDANDYAQIVMSDEEELLWKSDAPIPFVGFSLPALTLHASADIPGAIDPATSRSIVVIPEADAPLEPAALMTADGLGIRLDRAHQVCALNNVGDQWIVWWSNGSRVVACGELKAIASVRPEGIVRTYTNDRVPKVSVLDKLPSENEAQRAGGMDEAFAWASELALEAKLNMMPRPIGNALFGISNLQIRTGW